MPEAADYGLATCVPMTYFSLNSVVVVGDVTGSDEENEAQTVGAKFKVITAALNSQ